MLCESNVMSQGHPAERSETTVHVNLLFFAKSRELAGTSTRTNFPLAVADSSLLNGDQVLGAICEHFPGLRAIRDHVIIAVNEQYCEDLSVALAIREGDEIAVIPPIAGG